MKALKTKALFIIIIIYIFSVSVLSIVLLAPPPWKSHFVGLSEGLVDIIIWFGSFTGLSQYLLHCNSASLTSL